MGVMWMFIGAAGALGVVGLMRLSRVRRVDWRGWMALLSGLALILFTAAWSVSSLLEGEPQASSMGLIVFGLPGLAVASLAFRFLVGPRPDHAE